MPVNPGNKDLSQAEVVALEMIVDACGLQATLEALSGICEAKADHIAENYSDAALAKLWRSASGHIGVASTSQHVRRVTP